MQPVPEQVASVSLPRGALLHGPPLHLRDSAQDQADQLSDVEIGRSWVDSRFFPMNLTSFQDRLQRQPPARLVFAHGQQDGVQGLAKLQGLIWWNVKPR